jgi:hypothetical protein
MDRIVLNLNIFKGVLAFIPGLITFMYIVSIIAMVTVSFVIIITRFYKNLMTDEGYLMFTIPAKSHQLINSKLLISIMWTLASVIAVVISLFAVFANKDTFQIIIDGLNMVMLEMKAEFGGTLNTILIIELLLMILLSTINGILQIYASIAIGQLFQGHKVIGSFAAYIALTTAVQIFVSVIIAVLGIVFNINITDNTAIPRLVFPFTLLLLVIYNFGLYWVTNYIFNRKLNLD